MSSRAWGTPGGCRHLRRARSRFSASTISTTSGNGWTIAIQSGFSKRSRKSGTTASSVRWLVMPLFLPTWPDAHRPSSPGGVAVIQADPYRVMVMLRSTT